jgi:hypothetical protein
MAMWRRIVEEMSKVVSDKEDEVKDHQVKHSCQDWSEVCSDLSANLDRELTHISLPKCLVTGTFGRQ